MIFSGIYCFVYFLIVNVFVFPYFSGDVAILVNAGMSMKQALVYNLLSALTCYVGFVIGVLVGNINETFAAYTFGFAGGMWVMEWKMRRKFKKLYFQVPLHLIGNVFKKYSGLSNQK